MHNVLRLNYPSSLAFAEAHKHSHALRHNSATTSFLQKGLDLPVEVLSESLVDIVLAVREYEEARIGDHLVEPSGLGHRRDGVLCPV